MSNRISSAVQAQATVPVNTIQSAPSKAQPAAAQPLPTDTVQISAAAQALRDATENPAQTAREAAGGDQQARRLLAKEAADKTL
jgi:hypothetical protein